MFRQPFAIFGAIAFLSLLQDVIEIDQTIATVLEAVRAVTQPVWRALLSWIEIELAAWIYDYMTMGAIIAGMTVRMRLFWWKSIRETYQKRLTIRFLVAPLGTFGPDQPQLFFLVDLPLRIIDAFLFWPITMAYRLTYSVWKYFARHKTDTGKKVWRDGYIVFYETIAWALILLSINYALLKSWISI